MPSIFSSLGLTTAQDLIQCGESPSGRELVFLVDGLGADVLSAYASVAPSLSAMALHGTVTTSFPSTTATSLATLTTGEMPGAHGMLVTQSKFLEVEVASSILSSGMNA